MGKYVFMVLCFLAASVVYAKGKPAVSKAAEPINVVVPSGTPAFAIASLIANEEDQTEIRIITSPSLLPAEIINGSVDAAIIPSNLAAVLYNKGVNIRTPGGVIWGTLYVVAREETDSFEGLRGKNITVFGRGLTPDIILMHLFGLQGIDPQNDLRLNYVGGVSEAAGAFLSGQADYALIAEPALTKVLNTVTEAVIGVDIQAEWSAHYNTPSYPQAILVLVGDLWDDRDVAEKFIKQISEATMTRVEEAAKTGSKLMPEYSEELLKAAWERCNITYRDGEVFEESLKTYYSALLEGESKSIGGKVPEEDFWY